ncbi:MAG: phosphohistidine phosphatase [Arcticibacterium sp.]|jgi:phosphohistidine phosphatase
MTKRLFIIRHAQAEDAGLGTVLKDFNRDLTSKGLVQSARLGTFISEGKIEISRLISSPANRAFQTAKVFGEQLGKTKDNIMLEKHLYNCGPKAYLGCLNSLSEDFNAVAIFGHNPDITFFAEYLTKDDVGGNMRKASLIELAFLSMKWSEISRNSGEFVRRIDVSDLAPEL